jgi:hypothetical protein
MIATQHTDVRAPDVSECFQEPVEAPATVGRAAVRRLELLQPLIEGLTSMGLEHRIVWQGELTGEAGETTAFGLIWDFDEVPQTTVPAGAAGFASYSEAGCAKLVWEVGIDPAIDEGFIATITIDAWGTDESAREQLLDMWPIVGQLADQHAHRMLSTIKSYAEDFAEAA